MVLSDYFSSPPITEQLVFAGKRLKCLEKNNSDLQYSMWFTIFNVYGWAKSDEHESSSRSMLR